MLSDYTIDSLQEQFTEAVRKGIRLLDSHFGGGEWRNAIDHSELDLGNPRQCVLAHIFGSYTTGRLTLMCDEEKHGFCADEIVNNMQEDGFNVRNYEVYSILTSTWNDEADAYEYEGMPA